MVRGPEWMGETLGEMVGEGCERTEGNMASTFPVHLGTREPVGLPGLILCPRSLPAAVQSPSPAPTPPPRAPPLHSETPSVNPSNHAGPKPHPHTLTQGLTSKLQNSTLQRPSFRGCLSPSQQVLSRGPIPRFNVAPPRPHPQGLFALHGS